MSLEGVIEVLNQFGFPTVAFLLMYWLVKETLRDLEQTLGKIERTLTELVTQNDYEEKHE